MVMKNYQIYPQHDIPQSFLYPHISTPPLLRNGGKRPSALLTPKTLIHMP